jgi:acetyl-CoA carboxylase biotin carboxyl carrier protein
VALSDDDVREILRIIAETPLQELRLETEGFSLYVRRGAAGEPPAAETPARSAPTSPSEPEPSDHDGAVPIEAPMLGTFYRAPGPGEEPFVEVGATIDAETTVCIIEVMKMMNSVPAGMAGTVVEVAAENGELVEYGQPLFYVRPA